ncbi:microsomal signal peptidase 12kDa subunit [Roridomyces roridus]|uniref:Signal peptidase complex subunit 1 n=1 Tax=Roridomyces roridus TaxID=1738132 RepID=A0AAD7FT85_9AGAR|nr:microsomal signal peptidase 12kDa subunit [Roridomyces roridus]
MSDFLQQLGEGKIDFVGQQTVDRISRVWLIGTTIISFIVGFLLQSLPLTMAIFGGSTALMAVLIIPPWPVFNQHPTKWLPVKSVEKKD